MAVKKAPTVESLWRDYMAAVRKANQDSAAKVKAASEKYRKGMDKLEAKPKPKGKANVRSRPK